MLAAPCMTGHLPTLFPSMSYLPDTVRGAFAPNLAFPRIILTQKFDRNKLHFLIGLIIFTYGKHHFETAALF